MNKFLVKLVCSDDCTYNFTEVYPLVAENMLEAERIVRKEIKKKYFSKTPHPTISGVIGHSMDDIEIVTLDTFFQHA